MKNKVKKNIFLLLGFVCGLSGFAALLYIHYMPAEVERQYILKNATAYIQQLAQKLEAQSQKTSVLIQKDKRLRFSSHNLGSAYPCLVYSEGRLVFWPDNAEVFDLQTALAAGSYTFKLLDTPTGQWLAHSKKLWVSGSVYQTFTLASLSNSKEEVGQKWQGAIFLSDFLINSNIKNTDYYPIFSKKGDFLLGISLPSSALQVGKESNLAAGHLLALALVLLWVHVGLVGWRLAAGKKFGLGLLWLVLGSAVLRGLMLYFNFPLVLLDWHLFYPQYYAASWLAPSLGDLLVGVLMVGQIIFYLSKFFLGSGLCRQLLKMKVFGRYMTALGCLLVGFVTLYFTFEILRTLYFNAQWTLDITKSLHFSIFNLLSLGLFVWISIVFFLVHQLCGRLFLQLVKNKFWIIGLFFVAALICYLPIYLFYGEIFWLLPIVSILYWLLLWLLKLPYRLNKLGYQTYLYFFCVSVMCALLSASSLYTFNQKKTVEDKQKIATALANQYDLLAEYLLEQAVLSIKKDTFCINILKNKSAASLFIIQTHIREQLKSTIFNKYKIEIDIFDASGMHLNSAVPFGSFADSTARQAQKTDYAGLWIIKPDSLGRKGYVALSTFESNNRTVGFFAIGLQSQVVPANLPIIQNNLVYEYAIYKQNKLIGGSIMRSGEYSGGFRTQWLATAELFQEGMVHEKIHYWAMPQHNGNVLVISSPAYIHLQALTNFSFFFLILFGLMILLLLVYVFYRRVRQMPLYYATKIQIYLNIAFFLPLITISIVVFIVLAGSYKDEYEQIYIRQARQTTGTLRSFLIANLPVQPLEPAFALKQMSNQIIEPSQIAIFDPISGKLLAHNLAGNTNMPLMYGYLKPIVYERIIEKNQTFVLDISPYTKNHIFGAADVYTSIRNAQGVLVAIVAIRYPEFGSELNEKAIAVISLILNCFTLTFIAFLILSYPASHLLVAPLKLMTHKLTRTSLSDNEPVLWKSNDEIGLLVNAYNRMLSKLETGKQALANAEKENAWREMAKQVAHEIKNPLTPMKLSLQFLQNAALSRREGLDILLPKTIHTVLDQIDNLSEIASSFASFASMPMPKNEIFDLASLLDQVICLYQNNTNIQIIANVNPEPCIISADAGLLRQILNNLILNATQSVLATKMPIIQICLIIDKQAAQAKISITDNGEGILPEIRHKIFLPNFTTKYAGSGIGLALAKRGIEHAGGQIWFETQMHQGTTFWVQLPLANLS